jgi:hypothetical protein
VLDRPPLPLVPEPEVPLLLPLPVSLVPEPKVPLMLPLPVSLVPEPGVPLLLPLLVSLVPEPKFPALLLLLLTGIADVCSMILSGPEDEVVGASIPVPGRGVDPRLLRVGGLIVVRIAGANAPSVDECELRSPPGSTLSKKEPPEVLVVITGLKDGGSVAVVATGRVLTESDEACDDEGVIDIAFILAMYGDGVG